MQALCSTTATGVKGFTVTRSTGRSARSLTPARVVCKAQNTPKAPRVPLAAAAASLSTLIATHPALALVDDRLGGEGTGKILGVSGVEGWAVIGVFTGIWALFYAGQKDLGGDKTDDSGMSL